MSRIFVFYTFLTAMLAIGSYQAFGTERSSPSDSDTIPSKTIAFSPVEASEYIYKLVHSSDLWRSEKDTLRFSLSRLFDHYYEPFDSVRTRLNQFRFDSVDFKHTQIVHLDTLPVMWLNKEQFIIDTIALDKDPFITQTTLVYKTLEMDTASFLNLENKQDILAMIDSMMRIKDTIVEKLIDYPSLERKGVKIYRIENDQIKPPLFPVESIRIAKFIADSSGILISSYTNVLMASPDSPFYILPGANTTDSLKIAVETLLAHTLKRDSIRVFLHDIDGRKTPFWLTTGKEDLLRYWIKNSRNDSITIWMGNPSMYSISLILEEEFSILRREIILADDVNIPISKPQKNILEIKPLKEIPTYWKYGLRNSLSLNQSHLSNWSKGGESTISGMLDLLVDARYSDNEAKITWNSSGRLRYGATRTKEFGYRNSTNILELNSQLNKEVRNKLYFSSVFYMRTQIVKGYNYPNDSVVIAKFLNPATFTIGAGFEYNPFKNTVINLSLLSYKNTFVLDTANIDQRRHGIDIDKRAKQEMGGQLVVRNTSTIMEGFTMANSLRLFSNYLNKPGNIDIDWELIIEKRINWFSSIRINMQLIYDDDIPFPVLNQEGQPELLPDGSPKTVAKTQFYQFLGLSLTFKI